MSALWLVLFLGISVWTLSVPISGNMETKLIQDLMKKSEKIARPLKNNTDILKVGFSLEFHSFNFDEKDQTMTAVGYETLSWPNQILVWDPKLYGDINHVFLDKKFMWTPDITLFNSDSGVDVEYGQGNGVVYANGDVLLIRSSKAKVRCEIDSTRFPFDTLICSMSYGSWVYSGHQMDISLRDDEVDLTNLKPNPSWSLTDVTAEKESRVYPCCPEQYYTLKYVTKFQRNSSHYVNVLIFPAFLLSILTILLFLLPTHSSGRITLGVLLFCAFFVLLLYTSSLVSGWTKLPYFIIFLIFNLVVITLFSLIHTFIIKLSSSEKSQEVPKIVRTIMFDFLARIFCMKSIVQRNRYSQPVDPEFQFQTQPANYNKLTTPNEKQGLVDDSSAVDQGTDAPRTLETNVAAIRALTERYGQKMKDSDLQKKVTREWKDLAAVINRLFFIIYKIVVIIAVLVVYVQVSEE